MGTLLREKRQLYNNVNYNDYQVDIRSYIFFFRATSFPGSFPYLECGAAKDPGIGWSRATLHPEILGVINYRGLHNQKTKIKMTEKLSVLSRLGSGFNRCNFPSLCLKPLQVKCFEYLLKGKLADTISTVHDIYTFTFLFGHSTFLSLYLCL